MSSVKIISPEETYSIRREVLRKNIDLPFQLKGDFDEDTFHLGAFKEDDLVGIVSFMKFEITEIKGAQYQLRGMATSLKGRKGGFGNLLLNTAFGLLREKKIAVVWCNAREEAVGFYEKNGFKIFSEPFNIEKVGIHYKMKKNL